MRVVSHQTAEELGFASGGLASVLPARAAPAPPGSQHRPPLRPHPLTSRADARGPPGAGTGAGAAGAEASRTLAPPGPSSRVTRLDMSRWPRLPERQAVDEEVTREGIVVGSGWLPADVSGGGGAMTYESLLALDAQIEKKGLSTEAIKQFPLVAISQGEDCSICLEAFQKKGRARRLPCKHAFHPLCIAKWFKEHVVCPLCRYDCREMGPSAVT